MVVTQLLMCICVTLQQSRKAKQAVVKACRSEQFNRKVSERLSAVERDREHMQKAVQQQASRRGQKMEEIEV